LREEFVENGFDSKRTVHQCGSGVSSAVNHLAMVHAGLEGSRIYNGSWSEWVSDPARPVAKGV
jgi:thiosulfate/3-mercaptopyruvate sulfurtransferase